MEQIQRGEHKRKGLSFGIENSYSGHGKAWRGLAGRGQARQGQARPGKARQGGFLVPLKTRLH